MVLFPSWGVHLVHKAFPSPLFFLPCGLGWVGFSEYGPGLVSFRFALGRSHTQVVSLTLYLRCTFQCLGVAECLRTFFYLYILAVDFGLAGVFATMGHTV